MQRADHFVAWSRLIALGALASACSGNAQTLGELPPGPSGAAGMSDASGGGRNGVSLNLGGAASFGGASSAPECGVAQARDFIYIMDFNGKLGKFSPAKKTITAVGSVSCSTMLALPNLAIDQNGAAYVEDQEVLGGSGGNGGNGGNGKFPASGTYFNMDTENARCASPVLGLPYFSALAFVGNGSSQALYGLTDDGNLSSVDMRTKTATVVPFSGESPTASHALTGTGDGRLFDMVRGETKQEILEVAAASGAVTSRFVMPTNLGVWHEPIAFWGGRVYIFYQYTAAPDPASNAKVPNTIAEYDPETKSLNASFMTGIVEFDDITAAAVSSCAPLQSTVR